MVTVSRSMVLTTINAPTRAVVELCDRSSDWPVVVVGDRKTPSDWACSNARFVSAEEQESMSGRLAKLLPWNHYGRKNLGYLAAVASGATVLAETDDDNLPGGWPHFVPERRLTERVLSFEGWANIYPYFTDAVLWPRGLPLTEIHRQLPEWDALPVVAREIGVHQFLAAGDPDVDAIYRLTVGRTDHAFRNRTLVLDAGTMVPFNSQCTIWDERAFPLLYLPSHVSFRMTDIWRSFVAQVCLWATGLSVAYHGSGVFQERNDHDLHRDFLQEVVGYERNHEIFELLSSLNLSSEWSRMGDNLRTCYSALRGIGVVGDSEIELVDAWLADLAQAAGEGTLV